MRSPLKYSQVVLQTTNYLNDNIRQTDKMLEFAVRAMSCQIEYLFWLCRLVQLIELYNQPVRSLQMGK